MLGWFRFGLQTIAVGSRGASPCPWCAGRLKLEHCESSPAENISFGAAAGRAGADLRAFQHNLPGRSRGRRWKAEGDRTFICIEENQKRIIADRIAALVGLLQA